MAISSTLMPRSLAKVSRNALTPSVSVGPGNTALTVTPVPGMVSAMPRETASCAVLVMPYCTISAGMFSPDSEEMKTMRPQFCLSM